MRRRILVLAAGAAAATAAALAWWRLAAPDPAGALLRPDDADLVAVGAAVYAEHCAACHGAELEGEPNWREPRPDGLMPAPPHDASGHTWHHPDAVLLDITRRGMAAAIGGDYRSNMPAFEGVLTEEQIVAALSYVKSRWPAETRRRHDEMNARQAALEGIQQ